MNNNINNDRRLPLLDWHMPMKRVSGWIDSFEFLLTMHNSKNQDACSQTSWKKKTF